MTNHAKPLDEPPGCCPCLVNDFLRISDDPEKMQLAERLSVIL